MIDRAQAYTFAPFRNQHDSTLTSNENLDINHLLRGVWTRSLVGLILIAILSTTTYFLISTLLKTNEKNGTIVNVSGRQRMLSQRGALFALELATSNNAAKRAEASATLRSVADLMEKSHLGLVSGSDELGLPDTMSQVMNTLYFESPDDLDKQVKQYINAIRSLLNDADKAVLSLENQHLQHMVLVLEMK